MSHLCVDKVILPWVLSSALLFIIIILLLLCRLKRSPLALVLVVVILLLYLFLIGFCIRADKHDNKKAQAVYITENTSGNNPKAPAITER